MTQEDYLLSHIDAEPEHLRKLYHDANRRLLYPRMVSGHLQGRLLKMLTEMISPRRVLEMGTYAGYSAMCIAEGLKDGAILDTVEIDAELEPFLSPRIDGGPYSSKIRLHFGDVMEIAPRLFEKDGCWDMIFIDADKRRYPDYYDLAMKVITPGGWIIADNTLWDGKVFLESSLNQTVSRHTMQTTGVALFNEIVAKDPRVEKVILPLRDGLTLIHLKQTPETT